MSSKNHEAPHYTIFTNLLLILPWQAKMSFSACYYHPTPWAYAFSLNMIDRILHSYKPLHY